MTSFSQMDGLREELHENGFDAKQIKGLTTTVDKMMDLKIDKVLDSIESMRTEMRAETKSLRSEMGSLRSEMGSLRSEMGSLHSEMGSLRAEMGSLRAEMGSLRSEMTAGFKAVDDRLNALNDRIKSSDRWQPVRSTGYTIGALAAIWALAELLPNVVSTLL